MNYCRHHRDKDICEVGVHTLLVCTGGHESAHTVSVYWCVVGGEYELGVYADGRSYNSVCWECTLTLW